MQSEGMTENQDVQSSTKDFKDDIFNSYTIPIKSSKDALKLECLKIANSFSGSINAIEDNYNRLSSLVGLDK